MKRIRHLLVLLLILLAAFSYFRTVGCAQASISWIEFFAQKPIPTAGKLYLYKSCFLYPIEE